MVKIERNDDYIVEYDDVLQEASIVMWEKLDQLDDEDGFFPWGKTIIRFKCMNLMQKKKNERLVFSEKIFEA